MPPTGNKPKVVRLERPKGSKRVKAFGLVNDPMDIDWNWPAPPRLHINLGRTLDKFMKNPVHAARHGWIKPALREIGFPVDVEDWRMHKWNQELMPALETFYEVEGHSFVPWFYVVPHGDDRWPRQTWEYPLGRRVVRIRKGKPPYRDLISRQLDHLKRVNFSFDVSETKWITQFLSCFRVFAKYEGHCRVPKKFVVPSHAPWPTEAWGMKLGRVVDGIRSVKNAYADQVLDHADELKSLGFQSDISEYMSRERIFPSLEVFKKVYGHCDVTVKFVVPSESPWPQEAWGDKLGSTVSCIRSYGHYADQVAKVIDHLDAIGFVWGSSDNKWSNVILPALEMHYNRYGHSRISREFVVPPEDPWLKESWGSKLGICVNNMKYRGDFAKQQQQDQAGLQAIGLDFLGTS